jgi:hypothetical protein
MHARELPENAARAESETPNTSAVMAVQRQRLYMSRAACDSAEDVSGVGPVAYMAAVDSEPLCFGSSRTWDRVGRIVVGSRPGPPPPGVSYYLQTHRRACNTVTWLVVKPLGVFAFPRSSCTSPLMASPAKNTGVCSGFVSPRLCSSALSESPSRL